MKRITRGFNGRFIPSMINVRRIKETISDKNSWEKYNDVNQIIEIYELKKILDSDDTSIKQLSIEYDHTLTKPIFKIVSKFFKNTSLKKAFLGLNINYIKEFWNIISLFNINMTNNEFESICKMDKFNITDILDIKKLSNKFEKQLSEYIMNHPEFTSFIIRDIVAGSKNNYTYPKDIIDNKFDTIVNNYLQVTNPDSDVLYLIMHSKSKHLKISDSTKLKANELLNKINNEYILNGVNIKTSMKIGFDDIGDKIIKTDHNNLDSELIYNSKLIFKNLSYESIFQNFSYPFFFTDLNGRWNCISKKSNNGIIEELFTVHADDDYLTNSTFENENTRQDSVMKLCESFLSSKNINIEKIIKSYFEIYLPSKLNILGFYFFPSSNGTTQLEKCRNILIELESILHQFEFYYENKNINKSSIKLISRPLNISEIPSFIDDKYIYADSSSSKKVLNFLFSDQMNCLTSFKSDVNYSTTYETLKHEDVNIKDIDEYDLANIEEIMSMGILEIDEYENIIFDKKLLKIMKDLYLNEFICNNASIKINFYNQVNFLKSIDFISLGSSLLSKQEQRYFNYIMNNNTFSNNIGIRNSYLHGTVPEDLNQITNDYITSLRLTILIIIKIVSELNYFSKNIK